MLSTPRAVAGPPATSSRSARSHRAAARRRRRRRWGRVHPRISRRYRCYRRCRRCRRCRSARRCRRRRPCRRCGKHRTNRWRRRRRRHLETERSGTCRGPPSPRWRAVAEAPAAAGPAEPTRQTRVGRRPRRPAVCRVAEPASLPPGARSEGKPHAPLDAADHAGGVRLGNRRCRRPSGGADGEQARRRRGPAGPPVKLRRRCYGGTDGAVARGAPNSPPLPPAPAGAAGEGASPRPRRSARRRTARRIPNPAPPIPQPQAVGCQTTGPAGLPR